MEQVYDTIGIGYNQTRRADPYLIERIIANLQPVVNGLYLDIGCGTGNYLAALEAKGFCFYGIEPSATMLEIAGLKISVATLIRGIAEDLPVEDGLFDGVIGILTLHHWKDMQRGLTELHRVLKPGAKAVFFSFTPQQMYGYWLHHYFPAMIERCANGVPTAVTMTAMLQHAGFSTIATEAYFIQEELQDHFLYSHKYRPGQYLDEATRKGTSGFSLHCTTQELQIGMALLEADIASGTINEVIKSYENDLGDYLFFTAVK